MATLYLAHFDEPYEHAEHYLGITKNLDMRVDLHRKGQSGVALMRALAKAGIGFTIVRTWPKADRTFERRLKGHSLKRLCPVCNPDGWEKRGTGKTPAHMQKKHRRVAFTKAQLASMRRGYRDGLAGRDPKPGKLYGAYMRGYRNGRNRWMTITTRS